MAEIITCPKCERKLQVPDQFLGQTVQCPECRHQFVAQQSAVSATPIPAAATSATPRGPQEPGHAKSRGFDEEADDEIDVRRRRRLNDDDDDDDFPRHRPIRGDFSPHRGGLVMALGLVALVGGFAFCVPVVVGPIAWILGTLDLRAMREGRMDPSGEGLTRSGQICGIISTLFLMLGVLLVILIAIAN